MVQTAAHVADQKYGGARAAPDLAGVSRVLEVMNRWRMSRKLALMSAVYGIGLIASVAYTVVTLRAQENDGIVIGTAGALGRWNEQLLKEILLAAEGLPSDYSETADRFFQTLDALALGGEVVLDPASGDRIALPPSLSPDLAGRLRRASELTKGFMASADAFLRTSPRSPEYAERRGEMLDANRGAVALIDGVVRDLGERSRANLAALGAVVLVIGIATWVTAAVLGALIGRSIVGPLRDGVELLEKVAGGDLTRRTTTARGDEIGLLLRAAERMSGALRDVLAELVDTTRELHAGAQNLRPSAGGLADAARDLRERGKTMAAASEESTLAIGDVAAAAERCAPRISEAADGASAIAQNMARGSEAVEELTASVRSISSAIEEMSQSLAEVSRGAEDCAKVAADADSVTAESRGIVAELEKAAENISGVAGTIHDIADQTSLLALNATIEAASAGAAGKGFAVVASEVKALAQQTAHATTVIEQRIEAMRGAALSSARATERISAAIVRVTATTTEISRGVSEQTAVSTDIAASAAQAAQRALDLTAVVESSTEKIGSIASRLAELAHEMAGIARGTGGAAASTREHAQLVAGLAGAADGVDEASAVTQSVAIAVADQVETLRTVVGRFRT